MQGIDRIKAERQRQIDDEGWSAAHDDEHDEAELIKAGILYYAHAMRSLRSQPPLSLRHDGAPVGWPWDARWWKPNGPIRDLERAGALVLAERDRLKRGSRKAWVGHCDQKLSIIAHALDSALEAPDAN